MKIKFLLSIFTISLFAAGCHQLQKTNSDLNLDFEKVENDIPKYWTIYPSQQNYSVSLDSTDVKSGKYSTAIEFIGDSISYQLFMFTLPEYYDGEKITLSGYIKTENVADGYAGLCMRIDPQSVVNEMHQNGVTGTTDWKKYEIVLDMNPAEAQLISIGGLLVGKGKMWLDDFNITIDGKDIQKVRPFKAESFSEKAKYDEAFDKGSKIVFQELDNQKIDDLELLGKIWGLLKYHHPAIAKGDYNFDYELFRMLPTYLNANNHKQRDKVLIKWISGYGKIPTCKVCQATSDSAFLKPDLSWIEHSDVNQKLKDLLHNIYLNRNQGNHYYIDTHSRNGIPLFTNERTYEAMDYPDAGFRLLALFRYWNMIHYFSPYKYLTDKDWATVLREYIPHFIDAASKQDYRSIATLLIAEICDSHSVLDEEKATVESPNTDLQVPAFFHFVENKLMVMDYYAENAPLKKGDIITHINGKPVEDIVDSIKNYFPASNEAARMRDIAREILHFKESPYIRLDAGNHPYINVHYVSSDNKTGQKKLTLDSRDRWMYHQYRKEDTTPSYRFIDKDIGYITLKNIRSDDIPIIKKKFINTKGIIIDIRNYPAYNVGFSLGQYFVSNTTPFVKFTRANSDNPGEFIFTDTYSIQPPKDDYIYRGKLVVIVNEKTQSAAEFAAMVFRAGNNTTVIGSPTAGADGNISEIILPGGLKTWISGIGIYYPDGRETQRVGIVPDIEVKPTIQGIREGRDELLEKAIEIIKKDAK